MTVYQTEMNIRNAINGFDYRDLENTEFLKTLPYVRCENSRLIYVIRFPNSPSDYEDSIILILKNGKLLIHANRQYDNGFTKVNPITVEEFVGNFPFMGSYDKFVTSCFMSCAQEF